MTHAALSMNVGVRSSVTDASASIAQIDGLRGIAVLAVVLYHFFPALGGGFVGVDIFFVVSGFLIGGILWRELRDRGTIDYRSFLVRRIRRLAPAYFAMTAVSALVAYMVLLPYEFREFGKSLIASVVYLSNVQFFREAGYFDIGSESKVLLHTWSLSVEEQFYLVLPALLLVLRKRGHLLVGVLAVLFTASLIACVVTTPVSATATFFLFPFRAWELILGVLIAIAWTELGMSGRNGAWVSWLGLALLSASIAVTRPADPFPGLLALLPTVGTALIILNINDRNSVNRLLAWQPLVYVGLISYSLYLWHWPVLTLSSYYRDGFAGPTESSFWLALSFAIATASWRFIETPVRTARSLPPLPLVAGSAFASAALLTAGALVYLGNGLPDRFGPQTRMHILASADFIQDWRRCSVQEAGALAGVEVCHIGVDGEPTFLVWGDSHVRAIKEGVDFAARESGSSGLLIWRAGCPPLFDVEKRESATTPLQDRACTAANAAIRDALPRLDNIDKILLVGRWSYYASGRGTGIDAVNTISLKASSGEQTLHQQQFFAETLRKTLEEIGRSIPHVYVLQQVPEVPRYDSRDVSRRLAHGGDLEQERKRFSEPMPNVLARTGSQEIVFHQLAARNVITMVDLCNETGNTEIYTVVQGDRSFYFDNNHITNTAAYAISDVFDPLMKAPRVTMLRTGVLHDK